MTYIFVCHFDVIKYYFTVLFKEFIMSAVDVVVVLWAVPSGPQGLLLLVGWEFGGPSGAGYQTQGSYKQSIVLLQNIVLQSIEHFLNPKTD